MWPRIQKLTRKQCMYLNEKVNSTRTVRGPEASSGSITGIDRSTPFAFLMHTAKHTLFTSGMGFTISVF